MEGKAVRSLQVLSQTKHKDRAKHQDKHVQHLLHPSTNIACVCVCVCHDTCLTTLLCSCRTLLWADKGSYTAHSSRTAHSTVGT